MSAAKDAGMTGWVVLPSVNIGIRYAVEPYHVDFWAYPVAETWGPDDPSNKPGRWEIFDGMNGYALEEYGRAEWELRGHVKWDGCINWESNPQCMMHGCSPRHADEVGATFAAFYTIAKRHFDLLGDAVKPLPEDAFDVALRARAAMEE